MADGGGKAEVIHLWSTPRSASTSLMYSFAQRNDTEVLDEPLYANFLRATRTWRPYKDELLSKMESDGNKVVNEIIYGPAQKKYRFCKHIASQCLPGLPDELMTSGKHFILMRNPLDVLTSYDKVVPPSITDLAFHSLASIFSELSSRGKSPPVIDSDLLRQDPEATLRGLCDDLGISFQATMLKWESGPKPFDGMWAPYWYKSTHKSTGFEPPREQPSPFPMSLYNLLEQSLPFYNLLKRHVRQDCVKSLNPDLPVPANDKLLVWVGDEILPRESAKVSVFDSVVQGGDAAWEGLRVYKGKIFKLEEHLDRLFDSAKALAFANVPTREWVKEAIFKTLIRNAMFDNAHIRLTLTRGKKVTSGMSPAFNQYGCTLIVLAEWKPPVYDNEKGINLVTASTRRNSPNNLDSKIHHNNLLNNILAKIEGNNSHADDAIMLDKDGYVSETNATNIFLVKKGYVATPHADYCLPGITRATVMELVINEKFILAERRISLSEFHTADEVFTTGTMGELSPVVEIDGRTVGNGGVGPVTQRLQNAYKKLTEDLGVPIQPRIDDVEKTPAGSSLPAVISPPNAESVIYTTFRLVPEGSKTGPEVTLGWLNEVVGDPLYIKWGGNWVHIGDREGEYRFLWDHCRQEALSWVGSCVTEMEASRVAQTAVLGRLCDAHDKVNSQITRMESFVAASLHLGESHRSLSRQVGRLESLNSAGRINLEHLRSLPSLTERAWEASHGRGFLQRFLNSASFKRLVSSRAAEAVLTHDIGELISGCAPVTDEFSSLL